MTHDKPRPPLVLLVDDDEGIREVYGDVLAAAGFRVQLAATGQAAIEQARTLKPDLVVMDLKMPSPDGYEATRRLKADRRTRAIPVLAFTGDPHDDKALAAGCVGIIAKPCSADAFVAAIERHLPR